MILRGGGNPRNNIIKGMERMGGSIKFVEDRKTAEQEGSRRVVEGNNILQNITFFEE